jgi:hypothetical protein
MHEVVIILNELLQLFLKLHCISFFFNIGALSMFYGKQKKVLLVWMILFYMCSKCLLDLLFHLNHKSMS